MDGRTLFQAAGHHQLSAEEPPPPTPPHFLLHTDPFPGPISHGTGPGIQSHKGEDGQEAGSRLTQQSAAD